MKQMIGILLIFVLLAGLSLPCCAAEETFDPAAWVPGEIAIQYDFENQTLDEIMEQFMLRYNLSEENFSMAYYATGSGERWSFAEDVYRVAASTYKLALNMYYYDLEREGTLSPDSLIGEHSLREMHYRSIVLSDNDLSILMLYNLGEFWQYRDKIKRYCDQDYPIEYYTGNNINAGYLLSAIEYLYEHAEDYEELLGYLLVASPGRCFRLYDSEFPIAHKYGWFATYIDPEETPEDPTGSDVPDLLSEPDEDAPMTESAFSSEPEHTGDPSAEDSNPPEFTPDSVSPESSLPDESYAEETDPEAPAADDNYVEETDPEEPPKELILKSIAANDVAIVYTPEPYLIAALIEDPSDREHVLGKLCELMTEYTVYQTVQMQKAAAEQEPVEPIELPKTPGEADPPAVSEAPSVTPPTITVTEHPELEPALQNPEEPELPDQPEPTDPPPSFRLFPLVVPIAGVLIILLLIVIIYKTGKSSKQ